MIISVDDIVSMPDFIGQDTKDSSKETECIGTSYQEVHQ